MYGASLDFVKIISFYFPSYNFRTYRYAAYRQFTWWVHNRLGRCVRRVIPSCAVSRIRAEFEEESGDYTSFHGDDVVVSEIVKSMEWAKVTDDVTST